jgi:hypothetical protein
VRSLRDDFSVDRTTSEDRDLVRENSRCHVLDTPSLDDLKLVRAGNSGGTWVFVVTRGAGGLWRVSHLVEREQGHGKANGEVTPGKLSVVNGAPRRIVRLDYTFMLEVGTLRDGSDSTYTEQRALFCTPEGPEGPSSCLGEFVLRASWVQTVDRELADDKAARPGKAYYSADLSIGSDGIAKLKLRQHRGNLKAFIPTPVDRTLKLW